MNMAALWRGGPDWRSVAIRVWKVRVVALYFLVLLADGVRLAMTGPAPLLGERLLGDARLLAAGLVVVGGLLLLAWLTGRTTRYEIGERHVELSWGIALRAKLVIPFAAIEHVAVRVHRDHTGDLALRLKPGQGVFYPKLWPHVRPWPLLRAEPMLRCVPQAAVVGPMLCRAIAAANAKAATADLGVEPAPRASRPEELTAMAS